MGFFSGLLQAGAILALDTFAALLNAPKPKVAAGLKNKSYASDAYGNPWPRPRGVVRLQGKVIWMSNIRTTIRKTVSGGIFGIGSQSVYYNLYSVSMFVGFGKKLGGGPAAKCLRIWADDKLLFNSVISSGATLSGSITANGVNYQNALSISITLGSGASFTVNAGDYITVSGDNTSYEVQTPITATGPTTITVPIWPPLAQATTGGETVTLPGLNTSPYDLSSFDPDPHDGSHPVGGYAPCPPGGIRFYLGDSTQQPDVEITKILGAGNAPGYTGTFGVHIHDLQLRNYGDHPPQITAEWAVDVATPQYPQVGPIADMIFDHSDEVEVIAVPFAGNGGFANFNRLTQALPYVWLFTQVGEDSSHDGTIRRINTRTNQLEQSQIVPRVGTFRVKSLVADNDGFLYMVQNLGALISKIDGFSFSTVTTFTGLGLSGRTYCFDMQQSCFGNPVTIKILLVSGELTGTAAIFDRGTMIPWGSANPGSLASVVIGYTNKGAPVIAAGDAIAMNGASLTVNSEFPTITDDASLHLWAIQGANLQMFDFSMPSWVDLSDPTNPKPALLLPSLARTDIDVSAVTAPNPTPFPTLHYYSGDDSMIVASNVGKMGKVDVKTGALTVVTNGGNGGTLSRFVDVMGGLIMSDGSGWRRLDAQTLQFVPGVYNFSNWFPPGTAFAFGGYPVYDELTDSIWIDADNNGGTFGGLNRIFLDRGTGSGVGLDSIISSAIDELNARFGLNVLYDVSLVTAAGITVYGVEFDRESYADSLRRLMQLYLVDAAPIDGKIWFIPRGQSSALTIPEDDLGALDDPTKNEPRIIETIQDPQDTPEQVWIRYYDPLKQDQQAAQYAKRISKPYASALSSGANITNSRQQIDMSVPVTENATPIKQQAEKILWDGWAGRRSFKFKLPPKYQRLTPCDVITVNYKGVNELLRLEEVDIGATGALEVTGRSQDTSVYSALYLPSSSGGVGSSTGGSAVPPPPPTPVSYTISPSIALSQASATEVDMVQGTATWSDGRTTTYAARSGGSGLTVADPGAGNTQLYYVTIFDPNRVGELPGTPSLTAFIDVTPQAVFLGDARYVFIGTITVTHDTLGVVVTSGGSQNINQAQGFYVNSSGGGGFQTQIDVLTYLVNSQRSTKHLNGSAFNSQASNIYSYLDPSTHSIAQIKSAAGWAADIQLYFSDYVKQFITELDDPGYRLWSDDSSYKKYQTPLLMMPRYITPGVAIPDIVNGGSNPFNRYTACGLIDTINRGPVTCRNYLATMNFDNDGAGGGNLGTISTLVHERYAGNSRERMYWGLNLGFVKWDNGVLVSGSAITGVYKITNWSVHNKLVAGGGVTPSFSCGYGVGWP